MDLQNDKIDIMGIGINNLDMDGSVALLRDMLDNKECGYVVTPNAEFLYAALKQKDGKFKSTLNSAVLACCDGVGVYYASKILGCKLKGRVPGIELAENLMAKTQGEYSFFFLGSRPGIAEKAEEKLKEKYPKLNVCGTNDGYFKKDEAVVEKIKQSKADVVFVCLGYPKSEYWMEENIAKTGCTLMLSLGGSLDGYAGEIKRAPKFFRKLGLEWLYRLIKQPSRIGRMMSLPKFMFMTIGYRIKHGKNR